MGKIVDQNASGKNATKNATKSCALFCAIVGGFTMIAAEAEAQQRRARSAPPEITIQRRSFLDPGPVVPRDSLRNYVTMDTILREPVYNNQRGMLGLETLPRRFDPPGRPVPLFEF